MKETRGVPAKALTAKRQDAMTAAPKEMRRESFELERTGNGIITKVKTWAGRGKRGG
jgi:hypothetical protein